MPFELYRKPIVPASPAGLSTHELKLYLGVGRNNVSKIAHHFGIEKLHGIYPERVVWRQIFGVSPDDDVATDALREPLADINWVASATGVPISTMRGHLRSGHWQYDSGVQLGDETKSCSPRLRRWIPALIRNRRLGCPPPLFNPIASLPVTSVSDAKQTDLLSETVEAEPAEDVFSLIFEQEELTARQRRN
ncbi:hypothetical protein D1822_15225 [Phaeobacter inhibens]|uniref:hypothetical protein n=1 Tax=Phaeobacter inhibens TaxID=221822 RepID=UPI0001632FA0|nr:hypothetical protein [Phaeobacter inhibens]AFO92746.1 hypothetical protein PGA1_c30980 [Phaeobacter inhibens DSM 17395]AUQ47451.1 hypothetical protein PhaeoP10_03147 [Phaeobacter inhibens]AXT24053.1 hypothetical protein D1822_15225 [Phaeobacter inhibens]